MAVKSLTYYSSPFRHVLMQESNTYFLVAILLPGRLTLGKAYEAYGPQRLSACTARRGRELMEKGENVIIAARIPFRCVPLMRLAGGDDCTVVSMN